MSDVMDMPKGQLEPLPPRLPWPDPAAAWVAPVLLPLVGTLLAVAGPRYKRVTIFLGSSLLVLHIALSTLIRAAATVPALGRSPATLTLALSAVTLGTAITLTMFPTVGAFAATASSGYAAAVWLLLLVPSTWIPLEAQRAAELAGLVCGALALHALDGARLADRVRIDRDVILAIACGVTGAMATALGIDGGLLGSGWAAASVLTLGQSADERVGGGQQTGWNGNPYVPPTLAPVDEENTTVTIRPGSAAANGAVVPAYSPTVGTFAVAVLAVALVPAYAWLNRFIDAVIERRRFRLVGPHRPLPP
ncbi:hypothetical protein H9P43_007204 [Blastocladiella emersonii ATCC 22665]|nr:hypothetical protein H9P43_007204 [Blastocladiella emersonii ATCC 22665]